MQNVLWNNSNKRYLEFLGILMIVSFVMHAVWESMHIGLYRAFDHITPLPIVLYASLGDVLYTILVFFLIGLFKESSDWYLHMRTQDYVGFFITGFFISMFVEYKAFFFSRWAYLDTMPIIPFFDAGLSPVAQMSILLPCSLWITGIVLQGVIKKGI
jgi:hypothetical protein